MQIQPSFNDFQALADSYGLVPVWQECLFDVDTAVTAYSKIAEPPFGFLLESVLGGEQWARYSFVGTRPAGAWKFQDGEVSWWTPEKGWGKIDTDDPLEDLNARLQKHTPATIDGLPRFWGGAVGYFSYDIVREIEVLPNPPSDDLELPDGVFLFTDVVLVIDNLLGRAMAIAAVPVDGLSANELQIAYEGAIEATNDLIHRLKSGPSPAPLRLAEEPKTDPPFNSSTTQVEFEAGVKEIRDYIRAGDAFQVVLSQRFGIDLNASPFDLYRALRTLNPSPYLYFLELDGMSLVGSSPEVLVRVEDGVVTVRPIAGTRPRGGSTEKELLLSDELSRDEKELAEHRMLVDLGRNDLGRVAEFGSVKVTDLMIIERYSHVMHLVSQVEAKLREGMGAVDVFKACFPAGTVSGAPKIRAMEIIDELEPVKRGPYAGAVGYFNYGGVSMDTAITIRTLLATKDKAYVQAGAGIVADSDPSKEYEETLSKARALLRAAAMVDGQPQAENP